MYVLYLIRCESSRLPPATADEGLGQWERYSMSNVSSKLQATKTNLRIDQAFLHPGQLSYQILSSDMLSRSWGGYEVHLKISQYSICKNACSSTYDHRSVKTGHPVRSAIHKH
jgi:hypothetical protein